jgi:hypothetical protein
MWGRMMPGSVDAMTQLPRQRRSRPQHALRRRVGQPMRRRDRLAGDLAVVHVQASAQVGVVLQRLHPALVGERQRERQRRVVEREGRGARHRARHVGHAIVDDAVDHIGRMRMGGRLRRLAAAALVDGDVDNDRAGTHRLEHLSSDEFWRGRAGQKHRADDQIGVSDQIGDRDAGGIDRPQRRAELG